MGVLLAILKFIGLLLLGILLLILLLMIVIMCVPLKYRLKGQKNGEIRGEFYLRWLFGAIVVRVAYLHGKEPKISIKIFGRELGRGKKKTEKKAKKEKNKKKEKPTTTPETLSPDFVPVTEGDVLLVASESVPEELLPEELPTAEIPPEEPIEEILMKEEPLEKEDPLETEPSQEDSGDKTIARMAMEDTPPTKRLRRVKLSEVEERPPEPELNSDGRERKIAFDEEDEAFFIGDVPEDELADDTEAGEESKLDTAKMIWGKVQAVEDKKAIFIALKKLLGRMIKGVLPQDMFLRATVGTGDPTTTGYIMGLAGMLVAKFGDHVQMKGDFTKATLEDMEVRIKGKIILGKFTYAVLAFICAKPVRKTLWSLWKGRSKKNG